MEYVEQLGPSLITGAVAAIAIIVNRRDKLAESVSELAQRVARLEARFDTLEPRVDRLESKVDQILAKLAG
ncbi:MAG: hypothetical protein OXS33_06080 [bacterium]|nr:hypothetical protein [bacterium]